MLLSFMRQDRAYLTIMRWPQGFDEARRTDALASLLSVDRYRARELARRTPPAMYARMTLNGAEEAARQLRGWGAAAASVPGEALVSRLDPPKVKSLSVLDPGLEAVTVEVWQGATQEVRFDQIVALVRAHPRTLGGGNGGDFGVQALHQMQGTWQAQDWDQGHSRRGRVEIVEVLDIHTRDERQLRILGGKCSYECLGKDRADSVRDNIDALAGRLSAASGVAVDRGFGQVMFLAEFARDFADSAHWRDLTGFSIYSAWLGYVSARGETR